MSTMRWGGGLRASPRPRGGTRHVVVMEDVSGRTKWETTTPTPTASSAFCSASRILYDFPTSSPLQVSILVALWHTMQQ